MSAVAFILGSPNSREGVLSDIALERVRAARILSELVSPLRLMVTGGFGAHFNDSRWPHRELVHGLLSSMDVVFDPLQPGSLESCNTIEDMVLIGEIVTSEHIATCFIITSAFHVSRCRVIFDCVLPECSVVFVAAQDPDGLPADVIEHEKTSIEKIIHAGGIRWKNNWYPMRRSST